MKVPSSFPQSPAKNGSLTGEGSPPLSDAPAYDGQLVRRLLRRHLGSGTPDWFSPLSFHLEDGTPRVLTVSMPHELFFRWYEELGRDSLENAVHSVLGKNTTLRYDWPGRNASSLPASIPDQRQDTGDDAGFDDFLLNGRNREPVLIFREALLLSPTTILLRGASGTGKTHLARAAFHQLNHRFHGRAILLSGSEMLARIRQFPDFLQHPGQDCDAIVIDDLQLLEEARSVQRELAAALDMIEGNMFFIGTLSLDGVLLPELYDRLCSHLSLHLAEPDLDVRLRFAQMCMEKAGLPEHHPTALMLARHCLRLRHIQGVLEHVRLRYEQDGRLPSSGELVRILEHSGSAVPVNADTIIAAVASSYGYTSSQLTENTRNNELSLPRQIAMYLCRRLLGESYPSLGRIFGGKDHSTVMYAVKKIEKLKVMNKDMHILITKLTKQCINGSSGGSNPF